MRRQRHFNGAVLAVLAATALAGCRPGAEQAQAEDAPPPLAALPMTSVAGPPTQPGPVAVDLPAAPAARIGRLEDTDSAYAFLDRAYAMNDAFDDAPPDFTFDDDEVTPWVWESDDEFIRIVEPLPYGDRYYYFQPGEDEPFLIRDPDDAYGYSDGALAVVYDSTGAVLPPDDLTVRAPLAGRYLARGRVLLNAARGERLPVQQAGWTSHRAQVVGELAGWSEMERRQAAWRSYHEANARLEQAHWSPERMRREAEAARFAEQAHDPDGAARDWREARRSIELARRAHVEIASVAPRAEGQGAARVGAWEHPRPAAVPGTTFAPARGFLRAGPPPASPGYAMNAPRVSWRAGGRERFAHGSVDAPDGPPWRGEPRPKALRQDGLRQDGLGVAREAPGGFRPGPAPVFHEARTGSEGHAPPAAHLQILRPEEHAAATPHEQGGEDRPQPNEGHGGGHGRGGGRD